MYPWNSFQDWEGRTADISEPNKAGGAEKITRTTPKTSMGIEESLVVSGCLCHSLWRDAGSELPHTSVVSSLVLMDLRVSSSKLGWFWCDVCRLPSVRLQDVLKKGLRSVWNLKCYSKQRGQWCLFNFSRDRWTQQTDRESSLCGLSM